MPMKPKKAKKAKKTPQVAMPGCQVPGVKKIDEACEEVKETHWKAIMWDNCSLGTGTRLVEVPEIDVTLKSFMLKQQKLLEQLQTDFGVWMRAALKEEK